MTHDAAPAFRRARSPEQQDVRRREILDAAERLLGEAGVAEISLREIGRAVGCANSNILRYFGTREGVFLALLDREWAQWLERLERELPPSGTDVPVPVLADVLADSIAGRPELCKLMSALGSLLREGAPPPVMTTFRAQAVTRNLEAARLLADRVPGLETAAASEFVVLASAYLAGWWPLASPPGAVEDTPTAPHKPTPPRNFRDGLARGLAVLLTGLLSDHS
ncbi:TetR family transcriptional regulator [Streptomyces sp. NPDC026672]|uniref:TetR family transcriptional regulator n=1 Tax=unclassified Streptomyces TaxID=2593676 RepID=UPI0033F64B21